MKQITDWLDASECCQSQGGVGCHPSRCAECPRDAADLIRALSSPAGSASAREEALREALDWGVLLPPGGNASEEYLGGWCDGQDYWIANLRSHLAGLAQPQDDGAKDLARMEADFDREHDAIVKEHRRMGLGAKPGQSEGVGS